MTKLEEAIQEILWDWVDDEGNYIWYSCKALHYQINTYYKIICKLSEVKRTIKHLYANGYLSYNGNGYKLAKKGENYT